MVLKLYINDRVKGLVLSSLPVLVFAAGVAEASPRSPAPVIFGDPMTVTNRPEPAVEVTSPPATEIATETVSPQAGNTVVADEPRRIIFRGPAAETLEATSPQYGDRTRSDVNDIESLRNDAVGRGPVNLMPDADTNNEAPVNEVGIVGIYPEGFEGQPTSNGEIFQSILMTASHPTLPLPSLVRVSNPENGYETVVRVNDRGPFGGNRIMELSPRAGEALGLARSDTAVLHLRYLGPAPVKEAAVPEVAAETLNVVAVTPDALTPGAPQDLGTGTVFGDSASVYTDDGYYGAEPTAKPLPDVSTASANGVASNEPGVPRPLADPATGATGPTFPQQTVVASSMNEFRPPESAAMESVIASGYYVQAGSFYELRNAQRQIELLGQGLPVRIQQARVNNSDFFRVLYGPFPSWDAASEQRAMIEQAGAADTIIISR